MREFLENIAVFMEKKLQQRPSGWDTFIKEMASTFARAFDKNARVVWVSCYAFPMELLWAFDVVPFDFEIACNILPEAVSGKGSSIMASAESEGYSRDICSFYRLVLGAHFQGKLPRGDLFLTSSYYCNGKAKTNETIARAQGKESVLFEVPNEISKSSIEYVTSQLREIAGRLESLTGAKLDLDRLREAIRWSNTAQASFQQVNELMMTRPCPWDGYRACVLGIGGSLFWGAPVRDEINRMLLREMETRTQSGKTFPERYRVLWYPWVPVQPTNMFTILRENHVNVVTAESARVYWSEMDERNAFEALALKALQNPYVGTAERRTAALTELAEEYGVQGAIHFSTPACRHENGTFRIIADALRNKGIPVLNIEGDMTDERNYSEGRTAASLTGFLEILKAPGVN